MMLQVPKYWLGDWEGGLSTRSPIARERGPLPHPHPCFVLALSRSGHAPDLTHWDFLCPQLFLGSHLLLL